MKYARVIGAVAGQPWAIDPLKGKAMLEFLAFAAGGGKYSPSERAAIIGEDREEQVREQVGGVAVIPLMGVMSQRMGMMDEISGGASTDRVGQMITAASDDESVKAIIIHTASPGGSVYGTEELGNRIRAARDKKPVVAVVDSYAASAAYWAISQAEEIVIAPGGDVGSIGVYMLHEEISKLLEEQGIQETFISAGKYKVEGNPFEPLGDEAKEHYQAMVDDAYDKFISVVADGRGVDPDRVLNDFGQGRMVSAEKAVQVGMADRIATLDETIQRFMSKGRNAETERRRLALRKKR